MTAIVTANPNNPTTVPWVEGCGTCKGLAGPPEPGLFAWIAAVGCHFERDHAVSLLTSGTTCDEPCQPGACPCRVPS